MASVDRPVATNSRENLDVDLPGIDGSRNWYLSLLGNRDFGHVLATIATTSAIFVMFVGQGILIARVLGPIGRGEFGTAIFFPRDILLYVGLLGGVEIVNRYASSGRFNTAMLKRSAARLGLLSGILTATGGALLSILVLSLVDNGAKAYLIPYCLLICLFVPWEHMHLTISGVDRGMELYSRYNFNRLMFAAAFPLLVLLFVLSGLHLVVGKYLLLAICCLFVLSKVVGLLPTLRGIPARDWIRLPFAEVDIDSEVPAAETLLRDGRPYAFSMFATELFERLDILLILALATVQESGFYFVAIPAATLLTIAPNALAVFTFNAGAENRAVPLKAGLAVLAGTFLFQLLAMFCLALVVPHLIVLFYGEAYRESIDFVWYLLPACAIKGFLQAADGYLKGCGKPLVGVFSRGLSILAMLGFVYLAYQHFKLISIPMAACIGQGISMLIITGFVIRELLIRETASEKT